jgi:hypothetical protein
MVVHRNAVELRELLPHGLYRVRIYSSLRLRRHPLIHEPLRGLWKSRCAGSQDRGRNTLQSKWQPPSNRALSIFSASNVLCAIINPESNHDANCDTKLLKSDQTSSNVWWCKFAKVQGNDHGQHPDGETGNEANNEDHRNILCSTLNDRADEKDDISKIPAAGDAVGDRPVDECTKHGSEGKYGNHPALQVWIVGK